jgi:hypothetical protein
MTADLGLLGRRRIGRRVVIAGLAALPFARFPMASARTGLPTVGYVSGGDKGEALA